MPFDMGPWEIGLIILIVLIVFGAGKLPQVGGAIGRGIREFRKAQHGDYDDKEEKASKRKNVAGTKIANIRLKKKEADDKPGSAPPKD